MKGMLLGASLLLILEVKGVLISPFRTE